MVYFDGQTYEAANDKDRLSAQLGAVRSVMSDGAWRSLADLADAVGAPEASVSARLRDLRKPRFGSYAVERRHRGDMRRGLYEYRLVASDSSATVLRSRRAPSRSCPRCGASVDRQSKPREVTPPKQSFLVYDEQ